MDRIDSKTFGKRLERKVRKRDLKKFIIFKFLYRPNRVGNNRISFTIRKRIGVGKEDKKKAYGR